jgi:hypothetical protein
MLSVVMLNVVVLNVIMLSVMAPNNQIQGTKASPVFCCQSFHNKNEIWAHFSALIAVTFKP